MVEYKNTSAVEWKNTSAVEWWPQTSAKLRTDSATGSDSLSVLEAAPAATADTAAGSELSVLAASLTATADTGVGTEPAASLEAALAAADTGVGTEPAASLEAALAAADTGVGTEPAASLEAALAAADTGVGTEPAASLTAALTATADTGAGTEPAASLEAALTATDTGVGTEAEISLEPVSLGDSGSVAAETASIDTGTSAISAIDAGAGAETSTTTAEIAGTADTGMGAEATPTLEAALTATDAGAGDEIASLDTPITAADTAAGTDAAADLAAGYTLTDTGAAIDTSTAPSVVLTGIDTAAGNEIASLAATRTATADTGIGADAPAALAGTLTLTDTGAGADSGYIGSMEVTASDAGAGVEVLGSRTLLYGDSGHATDAVFYHMAGYRWPHLRVIRERVREIIDEDTALLWVDDELDRHINDAERDVAAKTMGMIIIEQATTVAGERFIRFTGHGIAGVEYLPESGDAPRTLQRILPQQLGYLKLRGNTPQYWFPWGSRVCIEPLPAAGHVLNLYEIGYPNREMSAEDDEPVVDKDFHELIVLKSASMALIKDGKFRKSGQIYARYAQELQNARVRAEQIPDSRGDLIRPDRIVMRG